MDRWRQTFFGASRSRLDSKSQDRGELAATVGPTCALSRSQANATRSWLSRLLFGRTSIRSALGGLRWGGVARRGVQK
jgi:hypothetical protein